MLLPPTLSFIAGVLTGKDSILLPLPLSCVAGDLALFLITSSIASVFPLIVAGRRSVGVVTPKLSVVVDSIASPLVVTGRRTSVTVPGIFSSVLDSIGLLSLFNTISPPVDSSCAS